jgi:chromosome partitioning protein
MRIVSVSNQKGGVGKTSTAINLSAYLAQAGKKVLLVDLDPQGSSTTHLGIDKWNLTKTMYDILMGNGNLEDMVRSTEIPNFYIAPTNNVLGKAEIELSSKLARESVLAKKFQNLDYDYVLIDTPPALGFLTLNALVACDTILVPIQCEFFALEGTIMLHELLDIIRDQLDHTMRRRYLLTMFDGRTNLSRDVVQKVREHFGDQVYETIIPQSIKIAEAPSYGKPISLYDPESPGALAYKALAQEVIANER